jgi:hypothetical protein
VVSTTCAFAQPVGQEYNLRKVARPRTRGKTMRAGRRERVGILAGVALWAPAPAHASVAGLRPAWEARFLPGAGHAAAVAASPDGSRVFVTGTVQDKTHPGDILTAAYDAATGDQLWSARYAGSTGSGGRAEAIVVSPDGSTVYTVGTVASSTFQDYATLAYDVTTGQQRWVKLFDGPRHSGDFASAAAISPDGTRVFVTGEVAGPGSRFEDWGTVAYDAATGHKLWFDRRGAISFDAGEAIGVDPTGATVFVTGSFGGGGATAAFDAATGALRWLRHGFNFGLGEDLVVAPDGSAVYVTGVSFTTIAYDAATGDKLWTRHYSGPKGFAETAAIAIAPDGGTVYVTGDSHGRYLDYATVAYRTSDGTRRWVRTYDGKPGIDLARDVGVSADGSTVFVTGTSKVAFTANDYLTIAYDAATGANRWIGRFDGGVAGRIVGGNDRAIALAVAPDHTGVYVTGTSFGDGTRTDIATLSYAP